MNKKSYSISLLEKLGFTYEQNAIYLSLLRSGPSSISDLVRTTGIHRPTVYRMLPGLIEKHLVSVAPKGKNKIYIAEPPQKLERLLQDIEDDFNSEIHELSEIYEVKEKKPLITFAEGNSAIKEAFSDVVHSLKKNDVYYRYSSSLSLARKKYVPKDYRLLRDRKLLERFVISDEKSRSNTTKRLGRGVRFVPDHFDLFGLDITQLIYGKKIVLIDYNSKTVITIENEMIAEFQKRIFKLLYSKL